MPRQRDRTSSSTGARLLRAATRLFADKGFDATSVGEIEVAVGLSPRRGTLYKHFSSKEELLRAVVDARVAEADAFLTRARAIDDSVLATLTRNEITDVVREFGRDFLAELDAHRDLTRIIEHDGERIPELAVRVRKEVITPGYQAIANTLRGLAPPDTDAAAHAAILLASLTGLRRTAWTFGTNAYPISDERALAAWANQCVAALRPFPPSRDANA